MVKQRRFIRWLKGLSGRLVLGAVLIHVLLIPILYGGVSKIIETALQDQFINEVRTLSGLLASQIELIDPEQNRQEIEKILDDVMLGGLTTYAELFLINQKPIHSSIYYQNSNWFQEDIAFSKNNDSTYFLSIPIVFKEKNITSALRLGFDEIPMQEQLYSVFQYTVVLLFAYSTLGVFFTLLLGRKLTVSIRRLSAISKKISLGQMDVKLTVKSQITDVADLVHDLEQMRSKLVDQAQKLEYLAHHDTLTSLPNRALFQDRLDQMILIAERNNNPFAVLLMDLNQFKEVNDTLGHHAGDEVLMETAVRIMEILRSSDTSARLGGDEFAIILHDTDSEGASRVAHKIHQKLNRPYSIEGNAVFLGVSIGIALYPRHGVNTKDLIRLADLAMYEAKSTGYAFILYHRMLDYQYQAQFNLRNDLRRAIKCKEFVLYYQPVLDLTHGKICGAEALIRWQHPERGIILPDEFIPVAERTGLIDQLTEEVLYIAAQQCRKNIDLFPDPLFKVAVNLSTKNLYDDLLPEKLAEICVITECPSHLLKFEMTETAIIRDPENVEKVIQQLKGMGCLISIDDFGTGYSSLSRLQKLSFDEIKIDKSFIQEITEEINDYAIVRATIGMAHDLGLVVVAEGVEDLLTLQYLQELGCDMIQGYLLSPPLPEEKFEQWMNDMPWQEDLGTLLTSE